MNMLGYHLILLIGPTVPVPAPDYVTEAVESVEVTHQEGSRSGFRITFQIGRKGPAHLFSSPLLAEGLLKAYGRVILVVSVGGIPYVLSDGIITHQQLMPGDTPRESKLVITGEDVSLAMDLEEKNVEHPAQPELVIVAKICASYARYGLLPVPVPPFLLDPPLPTDRIPVQRCTDLEYLRTLAKRFGYTFFVEPGPAPLSNVAYWGPPRRPGLPQPALSVNMGPVTNVSNLQFSYDSQKPEQVSGHVQDRSSNTAMSVQSLSSNRVPISTEPPSLMQMRKVLAQPSSGLSAQQALAYAQGVTDASFDQVVTAEGELDAVSYNGFLEARRFVGVRGAGLEYDGIYYVNSVTHQIERGSYRQRFKLSREGLGSLTPVLPL